MQYYMMELDDEAKEMCTITTPFGLYQYCRMPMGLKVAPDEAQAMMEKVLSGLDVEVYIDDIAIFSNSYEEHIATIEKTLARLESAGMKVNPLKCEWAIQETDFLGYWLTPTGLKPWKKKVDAVLEMQAPQNITQLRSFLGAVTYYRTMWPRRSHVLQPLTSMTGKGEFRWTEECQKAFEEMKAIIAAETLMSYPDHNKPFQVYADASNYQMGAAIIQDGRPVAYWSRKLNEAQMNYTTTEKELLAIVMCLKEFRSMLMGAPLTIFTDHKNLTFRTMNAQRVLRWRLFLEDYDCTFKYIEGKDNVLADCFSRLPKMEKPTPIPGEGEKGNIVDFKKLTVPVDPDTEVLHSESIPKQDEIDAEMPCLFSCCRNKDVEELVECFLNLPALDVMQNPITIQNIQQHQFDDMDLNIRRDQEPWRYPVMEVQGRPILFVRDHPHDEDQQHWKIALPQALLRDTIRWYHETLGHVGKTALYQNIRARFAAPGLKTACDTYECDICQRNKIMGMQYGDLPPRHVEFAPWSAVAVDLIGPWNIRIDNRDVEFKALTCIDPVTNLCELVRIDTKESEHVAEKFMNTWLARYPRPNRCIHDKGGEFIGAPFNMLLAQHGIENATITTQNPQANAVCERMHQTVANILRTTLRANPPTNIEEANRIVDNALATAMHAMRCSVSRALHASPGGLVFRRDMFVDVPLLADFITLHEHRQQMVDTNLMKHNAKRREWHFQVGDTVLLRQKNPSKLQERATGPFPISHVYTNGTVDVMRSPDIIERVNIRRLVPYKQPTEQGG